MHASMIIRMDLAMIHACAHAGDICEYIHGRMPGYVYGYIHGYAWRHGDGDGNGDRVLARH